MEELDIPEVGQKLDRPFESDVAEKVNEIIRFINALANTNNGQ